MSCVKMFFRDIGDVTLVQNLFRPIRFINRINSRTIWTPTYEDIGHIAKKTSNPPPKKINPHMYHFKRYQKAFTFFVSGGYMKFPNLIIRIILDFNKMYLYVKDQLWEKILSITRHSKLLRMHDTQLDGILSYL